MIPRLSGTRPVNVGIVGCGNIAQVFHLPILSRRRDVKIQAISDLDLAKVAAVAEKFNIKNVYTDFAEMLQQEDLEVLFVLTPNNMHLPMTLIALDQGLHVFVEKPAARNTREVERMAREAAAKDRVVMVGMQNRFRSDVKALKKFIQDKELGQLFFIKGGWLQARQQSFRQNWLYHTTVSGGGVLMDLGVQLIDLIWFLLDKPQVHSLKAVSFSMDNRKDVEDFCVCCFTFSNGVSFSLEVSWDFPLAKDRFFVELIGEKGTATLNPLNLQKVWHNQIVNIKPEISDSRFQFFKKGYENEVNHFMDYLKGRVKTLESPIEEAVAVHKMVDGIYQSIVNERELLLD
ncbi:MAG: Gfo/Idh/MocA family oxidoreductase [Calditrichia bacterium]